MPARVQPQPEATGDTLSERAALVVQRDILAGKLEPGARLGIVELTQTYGVGATPLREGLSRLVARGLVVALGQRGFRVAPISESDLRDITRMRVLVEQEALALAMKHGKDDWEAGIVATLYRMRRFIERNGARFREGSDEFDALHKGFHTALLSACGSPRLLAAHSDLYDQAYRYRRIMMRQFESGKRFVDSHADLADCILARNVRRATTLLEAHLKSTIDYVYPPAKAARS